MLACVVLRIRNPFLCMSVDMSTPVEKPARSSSLKGLKFMKIRQMIFLKVDPSSKVDSTPTGFLSAVQHTYSFFVFEE